jgi:hypothetical protein
MKKLLILLLAICLIPIGTFAQTETSANFNAAETGASGTAVSSGNSDAATFLMSHEVKRESTMTSSVSTALINQVGRTKIGQLVLNNNTRDGYTLTMDPLYGALRPAEITDGEIDIPYGVSISKSGEKGEGMDFVSAFTANEITNHDSALSVLSPAGASVVSATSNLVLDISIEIAGTLRSNLALAGDYKDAITFTYTDR